MAIWVSPVDPGHNELINKLAKESHERRQMTDPDDFQHSEEHLKAAAKAYCSPFPNNGYIASADEIKSALNDVDAKHVVAPKPSNEEIALRLVEVWARQVDFETNFGIVMKVYLDALNTLNEK